MISVGADVAQDKIDICIYDCKNQRVLSEQTISNNPVGFQKLDIAIKEFAPKRILLESTGGLEQAFCLYFQNQPAELLVLNPKQVNAFKRACFQDQKTDRIDARVLAHMAILHDLPKMKPVSVAEQTLQSLLRQRNFLVKERTAFSLRKARLAKQIMHALVIRQNLNLIAQLDREIIKLEQMLIQTIAENSQTQERFVNFQTIPGVGKKTAFELVQHLNSKAPRFKNAEKFCAYAGLYPTKRESGVMKGRERLTLKGCRPLRSALYLAALSNIGKKRKNTLWGKYYEIKLSQGKKPKQVLIAIANKIARAAWFVATHNRTFDPARLASPFA